MTRLARLLWPMLLAAMVVGVYHLKGEVEEREKAVAGALRAVEAERETIQMLRAEWTYLNQPERLRRLAAGVDGLAPTTGGQIAALDLLGQRLALAAPLTSDVRREAALPGFEIGMR